MNDDDTDDSDSSDAVDLGTAAATGAVAGAVAGAGETGIDLGGPTTRPPDNNTATGTTVDKP